MYNTIEVKQGKQDVTLYSSVVFLTVSDSLFTL